MFFGMSVCPAIRSKSLSISEIAKFGEMLVKQFTTSNETRMLSAFTFVRRNLLRNSLEFFTLYIGCGNAYRKIVAKYLDNPYAGELMVDTTGLTGIPGL